MEINMMQRQSPVSLPRNRGAALAVTPPAANSVECPRLARFVRAAGRPGIVFLRWLSRLGTGRIDAEALGKARSHSYSLRIRSIGH